MTSFYIATSLSRAQDHNHVRDALVTNGHRITYDWTLHGSVKTSSVQRLAEVAHSETTGVLSAEFVIVLLPGGFGTHAELGMALGSGKNIILHSADSEIFTACEKTCAFYHHSNIFQLVCRVNDTDAFLEAMQILNHQRKGQSEALQAPHFHSQVSDGVYVLLPDDRLHFLRVAPPSEEEIRITTVKIACRVHRYLEKRIEEGAHDELLEKQPLLAKCYAASIRYLSAFGLSSGKPLLRIIDQQGAIPEANDERTIMGFNLHASEAIEAEDRAGLERILRYMGRPPLSKERLNMASDGEQLILTLKSKWRDGTEKILLSPTDLIERLIALIPPPKKNQIRYHGFFGPNSKLRRRIVADKDKLGYESSGKKICRGDFAKLMARVFEIDVLQCPRCKSRMQRISFIQDPKVILDILRSLKMGTAPPDIEKPPSCTIEYDLDQVDGTAEEELYPTEY